MSIFVPSISGPKVACYSVKTSIKTTDKNIKPNLKTGFYAPFSLAAVNLGTTGKTHFSQMLSSFQQLELQYPLMSILAFLDIPSDATVNAPPHGLDQEGGTSLGGPEFKVRIIPEHRIELQYPCLLSVTVTVCVYISIIPSMYAIKYVSI